jgi:membrane protease YdiL (CAAX protease family)
MDGEISGAPSGAQPGASPRPRTVVEQIFLNDRGMRAGWRLLIYVALVAAFSAAITITARHFVRPSRGTPSTLAIFLQESFGFAVVFGAALIMSLLEKRSAGAYGLPAQGAFGKRFWQGWLVGLVEVCALLGLIAAFHGYSFGALAVHGTALLHWCLLWAVFFVIVGLFEEFMFRGYMQFTLADGIGFWPAAILLSVGFGAVHLGNPGEGWVGAASVVMIGLVFAFALRRTGNLWLVVGWHASFDFGETFLFSVPNSGIVFDGHLSSATLHGPNWLTGGTVGPEGSIFSFLTMAVAAAFIHFAFPPKKTYPRASSAD